MTQPNLTRATQTLLGFACLAAGVFVYAVARPVRGSWLPQALHSHDPSWSTFGAWIGSAPVACHVCAFSLLGCALVGARDVRAGLVCAFWAGTNLCFELAQHPNIGCFSGTFDPIDLGGAVVGGVVAFALVQCSVFRGEPA